MKKLFFLLFLICVSVKAENQVLNIPTGTNLVSTATTNTTDGTARTMPDGVSGVRVYVGFTGSTATTNGVYTVYLRTATSSTGIFDISTNSNIKVDVPCVGLTNGASLWFNFTGINAVKVGRQENTSQGPVSNATVTVVIPTRITP